MKISSVCLEQRLCHFDECFARYISSCTIYFCGNDTLVLNMAHVSFFHSVLISIVCLIGSSIGHPYFSFFLSSKLVQIKVVQVNQMSWANRFTAFRALLDTLKTCNDQQIHI